MKLCRFRQVVNKKNVREAAGSRLPHVLLITLLIIIDFYETPVMDPGNSMLGAFNGNKVASHISNSIGEVCQHILIDALARSPVHVLQITVTRSDEHVLAAILTDIIASDSSNEGIGESGQYVLMDALARLPQHFYQVTCSGPNDGMLGSISGIKVAANISDKIGEVRQHILMNALARLPVHFR